MLTIGHRGARGYIAENTLESIQKALDLNVDGIEIDVFRCASGEIVVFHDKKLKRLTGHNGLIEETTFEELKNIIIENINVQALFISIPSLLILFLWSSFEKKIKILKNIPSPLIVLIIGTSIAYFMNFKIDVLFINKSNEIIKIKRSIPPWRKTAIYFSSKKVLELMGGVLPESVEEGDMLEFINV